MRARVWHVLLGALVSAGLVVGLGASPAAGLVGTFEDDDGNVHEALIEILVARDVTIGCNTGGTRYCPTVPVSRAQMASFVIRALRSGGATLPAAAPDAFIDDDGNVHEPNIDLIAALGISLGDGVGHFRPSDPITRGEMALFIRRGFKFPPATGNRFTDVSGLYVEPANAVASAGVSFGCNITGTLFCPNDVVNRDQMASFLVRALASNLVGISLPNPVVLPPLPGLGLPPLPGLPTGLAGLSPDALAQVGLGSLPGLPPLLP